jgi:hypothetical protein
VTALFIVAACTLLNFAAGRKEWLPFGLSFRPLFAIAPAFAALCFAVLPWWIVVVPGLGARSVPVLALAFAAAFVLWRGPSWGHVYQLGHVVPTNRPAPWHERMCQRLAGGNVYGAALIRHAYLLPPLLAIGLWPALALPVGIVAAYAFAIRINRPVVAAEPIAGALWGLLIVIGAMS